MQYRFNIDRLLVGAGGLALLMASAVQAQPVYEGLDDLPQIDLRMGETMGPTAVSAAAPLAFAEYVKTASKGKINIEVFWSNALYTPTESAESLGAGIADIGNSFAHFRPSDFPVANWMQTVGVEVQGGNPYATMVAQGAAAEFFASTPEIIEEFASRNLKLLGGIGVNAYDIMCKSPVSTLAEAAGKRTRTGTTTLAKEAQALGMVATPIDSAEAYEAFSRGIIECGNMEPAGYISTGMISVPGEKYWTPIELTGLILPGYAMNLDKWNSLPPVAQKIIQDAIGVHAQKIVEQRLVDMRIFGDMLKNGEIKGLKPADDMQKAVDDFERAFLDDMVNQAPPSIQDPQAVKDRFLELLAKWDRIVREDLGVQPAPKEVDDIVATWYLDYPYDEYGQRFATEIGVE